MSNARVGGIRRNRLPTLAAGLLVLGLAATTVRVGLAQDAKAPAVRVTSNALVTKDQSVAETVQLINESLAKQWAENQIQPSPTCSDYEFIRRLSLDLIGRIATPEEIQEFLSKPQQTRRSWLVEKLLASDEYPRNWANLWSNWLLGRAGTFGRGKYHDQMHTWLEDQFAQNRRFHQLVTDLLTATGKNSENGAVNFFLAHLGEPTPPDKRREDGPFEMVPITSRITRLFLGIQTQCTQCHDHPFDANLKQHHFWGINAFLRQVKREPMNVAMNDNNRNSLIDLTLLDDPNVNTHGSVFYEKRNGVLLETRPVFLDGTKLEGTTGRRAELARLIVEHESFPKAFVNRMWGHFFGRGFTNPVDDFNEQNIPSNPELLDALAAKFKHYGFDQKSVIRWICNSNAYGLSCVANKTNDKPDAEPFFSRMLMKAMSPEQLFESLMVATQAEAAQTKEAKKQLREQWLSRLIANFGDDEGNEVTFNGTVVQALLMMNGKDINDAITGSNATVARMLQKNGPNAVARNIQHLYLVSLNRPPSQAEVAKILSAMRIGVRERNPAAPWHEVFWALLNSNEFMLNH